MISPEQHGTPHASAAPPSHKFWQTPSLQERVHCNCLGHSHTCSSSIRKAMRRHHPKRDMRADLGAAGPTSLLANFMSWVASSNDNSEAHHMAPLPPPTNDIMTIEALPAVEAVWVEGNFGFALWKCSSRNCKDRIGRLTQIKILLSTSVTNSVLSAT